MIIMEYFADGAFTDLQTLSLDLSVTELDEFQLKMLLMQQLAAIVRKLHEKNIPHRLFKPSYFMVKVRFYFIFLAKKR